MMRALIGAVRLAVATTTITIGASALAAEPIRLSLATGHPEAFTHVRYLRENFVPEVERLLDEAGADYEIQWQQAYGGTLIKTGSELPALQQGIVDIAYVPMLFYASQLPLEQVTYQAPFLSSDGEVIRDAMESVRGEFQQFDESWSNFGLTMLSTGNLCDDYNLMLKEPAKNLSELRGRRIFAPGPAANWLKETGAVAVAGNMSEYYQGLQSGVADGVLVLQSAMYPGKYHEVAPFLAKVNLGAQWCSAIAINTQKLEGLPEPVQIALKQAAESYSVDLTAAINEAVAEQERIMQEEGLTIIEWSAEGRKEWADALPNIAQDWAATMDGQGLPGSDVLAAMQAAIKASGGTPARDWVQ